MRISDWSSDVCSADLHSNKQRRKRRRVTKGPNTAITSWVEAAVLSTCLPNNSADCSCRQQRALSAKRMSPDESDDLVYRQQAALVVVVAAVAADATSRIGVCRVDDNARFPGYAHQRSHPLTDRRPTGPGGRSEERRVGE